MESTSSSALPVSDMPAAALRLRDGTVLEVEALFELLQSHIIDDLRSIITDAIDRKLDFTSHEFRELVRSAPSFQNTLSEQAGQAFSRIFNRQVFYSDGVDPDDATKAAFRLIARSIISRFEDYRPESYETFTPTLRAVVQQLYAPFLSPDPADPRDTPLFGALVATLLESPRAEFSNTNVIQTAILRAWACPGEQPDPSIARNSLAALADQVAKIIVSSDHDGHSPLALAITKNMRSMVSAAVVTRTQEILQSAEQVIADARAAVLAAQDQLTAARKHRAEIKELESSFVNKYNSLSNQMEVRFARLDGSVMAMTQLDLYQKLLGNCDTVSSIPASDLTDDSHQ